MPQIFLRSANCTSRDDESGFTWLYPSPVVFGEPGDRIEVCVSLLQWFPILRNLDTPYELIEISPTDPNGSYGGMYWTTIIVPRGNYTANDIADRITKAFETFSDARYRLKASFDQTNLQLVIKRPDETSDLIAITGQDRIMAMCGFTGEPTYREVGYGFVGEEFVEIPGGGRSVWTGVGELRSPSLVNFAGATHAVVETSLLTTNVADGELSSSVLAKVPIVGQGFGELQTYQDTSTYSTMTEHEITSLTVRFRDSFGHPIEFGDLPWNMSLLFRVTPSGVYRPLESNYSPAPIETNQTDGRTNEFSGDSTQST